MTLSRPAGEFSPPVGRSLPRRLSRNDSVEHGDRDRPGCCHWRPVDDILACERRTKWCAFRAFILVGGTEARQRLPASLFFSDTGSRTDYFFATTRRKCFGNRPRSGPDPTRSWNHRAERYRASGAKYEGRWRPRRNKTRPAAASMSGRPTADKADRWTCARRSVPSAMDGLPLVGIGATAQFSPGHSAHHHRCPMERPRNAGTAGPRCPRRTSSAVTALVPH